MGNAKALASDRIDEAPLDLLSRGEANRVHQDVQAIPVLSQGFGQRRQIGIDGDVAGEHDLAAKFGSGSFNTAAQTLILIGEGQFGPFAGHRGGNALGNGSIAGDTADQRTLASEKGHGRVPVGSTRAAIMPTPRGAWQARCAAGTQGANRSRWPIRRVLRELRLFQRNRSSRRTP